MLNKNFKMRSTSRASGKKKRAKGHIRTRKTILVLSKIRWTWQRKRQHFKRRDNKQREKSI